MMWKQISFRGTISKLSERIILFILLHFVLSSLVGIFLSAIAGKLMVWIAITALVFGTAGAWYFSGLYTGDLAPRVKKLGVYEILIYLFIFVAGLRHFGYMFFSYEKWYRTLLIYNVGDLPLHLSYIRHMSAGGEFPPNDPTWVFDKLRYPLGMDFYNAMWDTLGLSVHTHLFFTGIILLVVSILLLRWWGGVLLMGSFFLSGAWAGWQFLASGETEDYLYTVLMKNFFLQHFLTQRGFLISIPLGAFVLKTAYEHIKGNKTVSRNQALLLGFLWGSIACFHLHSFVIISLLIGSYFLLYGKFKIQKMVPILALAMPIGIFAVGYLTNWLVGGGDYSLVELDVGWYATKQTWGGPNLFHFWWFNMGLWLIFIMGTFLYEMVLWIKGAIRKKKAEHQAKGTKYPIEWILILVWFVFFNIVMIGAWDRDNNLKFMIWLYLSMIALASKRLNTILEQLREKYTVFREKKWIGKASVATLCTVLFFSGGVCVLMTIMPSQKGYFVYDKIELENVKKAVGEVPPDTVFATVPTFNHPLTYWGYRLVMGYDGHVWSHGYNFSGVKKALADLYDPKADWRKITKELKIDYIFQGPWERHRFGDVSTEWMTEFEDVSDGYEYRVYRVK